MHKTLHPNRWLIWTGAIAIFIAIVLVGYIEFFKIETEKDAVEIGRRQVVKKNLAPLYLCGLETAGKNYNISNCNVSCETDDDCIFTCGCGAINKSETCNEGGVIWDCINAETKCKENVCTTEEERF